MPAKLAIDPKKFGRRKMGDIVKATDDIKSHVEEKYFPNQKYLELVFLKSIKECNMRYADLHRFSLKYFNFSTKKNKV